MLGKRLTIVGLLQAAAIVTLVFSLVTSVPSIHHHVELFSHFRLQYLGVSILLLLFFAALRNPAYSIAMIGVVALNASYVLPWYFSGNVAFAAGTDTSIRLMNANVLSQNEQYDRLLQVIKDEQPDVVFLQEVSPQWLSALEPIQKDYPYHYAEPRHDNFGIAVFSRLRFDAVTHVDSPPLDYPTIIATMTVDGSRLTLINTHPMIPLDRSGFEARNQQLESIAAIVTAAQGSVVLSGDFNTSMWSPAYQALEEASGLRNARRGNGILPTWPTFMPFAMIPIDHILVSDDIGVVGIRKGARFGSDHLPLILELTVGP
ncbi:MAG: endonuclease/exonuclease/phosphatase family protein [Gammaproteobacteria bacterium]|nr:endonuclease/exonuclease/phosphatase family protein [Gammaproteobacteria bacterium]